MDRRLAIGSALGLAALLAGLLWYQIVRSPEQATITVVSPTPTTSETFPEASPTPELTYVTPEPEAPVAVEPTAATGFSLPGIVGVALFGGVIGSLVMARRLFPEL